ncbi:MAG: chorismate mutase [Psychrilyobacter sp.]|nr:chorismate mutase [Psychrilyobacter sp.]
MGKLFEERMNIVKDVALYKKTHNMEILDDAREKVVIEKNIKNLINIEFKDAYTEFLEDNMKISKKYQKKLLGIDKVVGYQGVEGSFSHIALKSKYSEKVSKSYKNFEDVFSGMKDGEIEIGVLPIENSYTGDITDNFDLIKKYNVFVVDIIELKINHNLLGVKGSKIMDIKEVYSHIQGFKQSQKFLSGRGYKEIPYYNTAISAKYVSELGDITKGAIGSAETAKLYNLDILAKNINTNDNNTTKFMVIKNKLEVEQNHNRTMIVFSTHNKSGDLSSVLGEFSRYGINMLSIKSRPLKEVSWEYMFFVELEGNYEKLKKSIDRLKEKSKYFEVIGSYEK